MRILLLGDYSSVHTNLKKALVELGHSVTLASDGDDFKNYDRDIDLKGFSSNSHIRTITRITKELLSLPKMRNFDIVQLVNPSVFSRYGPSNWEYDFLKNHNGKVFLLAAGDDSFYYKAFRLGRYKYSPINEHLRIDKKTSTSVWEEVRSKRANEYLVYRVVNAIIPLAYTYHLAYCDESDVNLTETVPFPIDLSHVKGETDFQFSNEKKIVFLHGIQSQRIGFKGSLIIEKAMRIVESKYKNQMIYKSVSDIPYKEYINVLKQSDVVIDQINGLEPAMNALISMAMGKIVMGGADESWLEHFNLKSSPLIGVKPEVEDIILKAEQLIQNRSEFPLLSRQAIDHVIKYHDSRAVARQFLKIWESY